MTSTIERTCCVCREKKDKRDMLRVTRDKFGAISLDLTGKADGRGAYLCRSETCVLTAEKRASLSRALKTPVDKDVYALLIAHVKTMQAVPSAETVGG